MTTLAVYRRTRGTTGGRAQPAGMAGDRRVMEKPRPEREPVAVAGPSADLALAILNGLDISSLPVLRELSTGARTRVQIPWFMAGLEQATAGVRCHKFLLGGRQGERYSDWDSALKQRPECRLNSPDTATPQGLCIARMHNSTVGRMLDGLVAAQAVGSRQPDTMN